MKLDALARLERGRKHRIRELKLIVIAGQRALATGSCEMFAVPAA